MKTRRILINVMLVVLLLVLGTTVCQARALAEEDPTGESTVEPGSDVPALPDEELGAAGEDPWLMLDLAEEGAPVTAGAASVPEEVEGLDAAMDEVEGL